MTKLIKKYLFKEVSGIILNKVNKEIFIERSVCNILNKVNKEIFIQRSVSIILNKIIYERKSHMFWGKLDFTNSQIICRNYSA